ncbi:MAG: hypothetical protein QOF40_76 [Actinomycetota bacterium]|nr:hypothetical protein [Actinomycetota bacterium]
MNVSRTHPAKPTPWRRFVILGVVLSMASVALVLTAGAAFAHHAIFTGETVCNPDGTWTVDWGASNSQTLPGRYMLVRSVQTSEGSVVGIQANGSYFGVVDATHPDASEGGGTVVPPDGTAVHFSTPDLPNSVASVTLAMVSYWHYPDGDGFAEFTTYNEGFTVNRPESCVDTRPGHITVAKATTGDTAPPGPFTFLVNRDGTTVTTITVPANGTGTSGDLEPGTYTLVEVGGAPGATITPNPVEVPANTTVTVAATNPYPNRPQPPIVVEVIPPVVRTVTPPPAPAPPVTVSGRFTG